MEKNVGNYDKLFRFILAFTFLWMAILPWVNEATYMFLISPLTQSIVFGVITLYFFLTILISIDFFYYPFKINTAKWKPT